MKWPVKALNYIMAIVFILSTCSVDSDSYIPMAAALLSLLYLVIVGAIYGEFEADGDY
jgi:hypothetical protein